MTEQVDDCYCQVTDYDWPADIGLTQSGLVELSLLSNWDLAVQYMIVILQTGNIGFLYITSFMSFKLVRLHR